MKLSVITYHGAPAIRIEDTSKGLVTLQLLSIDEARQLRDELTAMIQKCVIIEAVRLNKESKEP